MNVLIDPRKYLPIAFALAALALAGAGPAVAKDQHMAPHASRLGYAYAPADVGSSSRQEPGQVSGPRSAAIRECNKKAEKFSISAWQTTQLAVYRSCMANHGQAFG